MTVSGATFSTTAVSSTMRPPKKALLDDLTSSRIDLLEHLQRIVERHQIRRFVAGDEQALIQGDPDTATSFLIAPGPRRVHEDAPHETSRHRQKCARFCQSTF
jgi:hypothetical protein